MADSDEHDEEGHITEDLDLRVKMVDKRRKKMDAIVAGMFAPELVGKNDYQTVVVGWGSTYPIIKEALAELKRDDIAFLHFKQVFPVHKDTARLLNQAKRKIIIENNAESQFGNLIKLHAGVEFDRKILKYNGLPFSVEELAAKIKEAAL